MVALIVVVEEATAIVVVIFLVSIVSVPHVKDAVIDFECTTFLPRPNPTVLAAQAGYYAGTGGTNGETGGKN